MRLADFEAMVDRLAAELPAEFRDGIEGIEVSRKTLPHPVRAEVFTLGECIPVPAEAEPGAHEIRSRIVLYHGSFKALAGTQERFDWREEVWETLLHELRHHLEWRARAPDLEAFDEAAEQNFARQEGEPFAPDFHLAGEAVAEGVYRLDDDFFLDRLAGEPPARVEFHWHGKSWAVVLPPDLTLPAFLTVEGVDDPPPGDLVLVLRRAPGLLGLLRRPDPPATLTVRACPA